MAGNYDNTPNVAPDTSSGNDYLNVRSTPNDFGAQVGEGTQKLGQGTQQLSDVGADYAIKRQGQINETIVNHNEQLYTVGQGEINDKYKSKTGLDAVAAHQGAVNDTLALYNKIRDSLPSDATRRMFDTVAQRGMAYQIRDMGSYAATQQKAAYTTSLQSSAQMYVDQLNDPNVANDDTRSGFTIGNMKAQLLGAFTAGTVDPLTGQTVGGYGNVTRLGTDGKITFDDTPIGKQAEASWNQYYEKYYGQAMENRYNIIATDPVTGDPRKAVEMLEAHRPGTPDGLPPAIYAKIARMLDPLYKNLQTRDAAHAVLNENDADYQKAIGGTTSVPATGHYDKEIISSLVNFHGGETGDANHMNFTPEFGSRFQSMLVEYNALTGNKVEFNSGSRSAAEQGDMTVRGTAPAAPVGTSHHEDGTAADLNTSDVKNLERLGLLQKYGFQHGSGDEYHHIELTPRGSPVLPSNYTPKYDWYDKNYGKLMQDAQARFEAQFPGHPELSDLAMQRYETYVKGEIAVGVHSDRADKDDIGLALDGKYTQGKPLTDMSQLDLIPEIRDTWHRAQQNNPFLPQTVQGLIKANAQGPAPTYGSNFWKFFGDAVNGNSDDPMGFAPSVGDKNSPLTNTGWKFLKQWTELGNQPDGQAFRHEVYNWLNSPNVRGAITATGLTPGAQDPVHDAKFEKFLMTVLPRILDGKSRGLTSKQMFDDKSPDYVGGSLNQFRFTDADRMKAMTNGFAKPVTPGGPPPNNKFDVNTIRTLNDLQKAARENKINKEQYDTIAKSHNYWQSVIPTPH